MTLLAAGLLSGATASLAQSTNQTATETPATNAVGPRELQNFSINGTVTRRADQPAQPAAPPARQPRSDTPASASSDSRAAVPAPARQTAATAEPRSSQTAARERAQPDAGAPEPLRQTPPAASVTVALPTLDSDVVRSSAAAADLGAAPRFAAEPEAPATLAPEHKLPIWPWLLAAVALGAGGAFLFWRNRSREAFAGGPQFDAFSAPEPVRPPAPRASAPPRPAPAPAPQPTRAPPPPSSLGIVSTRLRPWVEIGFKPLQCIVEGERITIDFEFELFNSGSAPARAVLVEASLFNASAEQDSVIAKFFANPVGEGERIVAIPPLKRMALRNQVVTLRDKVQAYEVGGRQVFVPLIGFNALYRWSNGEGQTSVAYLLGRETRGEKLAPFRLDLGARVFSGLGSRLLPVGVRS